MRHDNALISDMLEASQKVIRFTDGLDFEQFAKNDLIQSAVVREIIVIGEAARNVSEELKNRHTNIQWKKIIGMRNKLVHDYFGILEEIVWVPSTTASRPSSHSYKLF